MLTQIDGIITGSVSALHEVTGTLAGMGDVSGTITVGGATDWPEYGGAYEITPAVEAQTLETANKLMTDDLTVRAVPYYQTSNITGDTVYIAMEV